MKAVVTAWEVKDTGVPALWTRQEHTDGSITYEGISEVTMKFTVVGNIGAAQEFLEGVRVGQPIKSLNFGDIKSKGRRPAAKGRMYVFTE